VRLQVSESAAEQVDLGEASSVFIVRNQALENLLFDRALMGVAFRRTCLLASRLFLRHILDELSYRRPAELLILSKGLAYQLGAAYADEAGENLPVNVVATTRVGVEADDAKIDLPYGRLDAGGETLVIGDTVASGATIVAALDEYVSQHALSHVYLLSYAGTSVGARRIASYCRSRSIGLSIMYGLASFGLGENGFDLSFLHPDTITSPEYAERARSLYGDKQVSAVGWDFGSQMMAPDKYMQLSWVEARALNLDEGVLGKVRAVGPAGSLQHEEPAFRANADRIWPGRGPAGED
jgi:hypothetical protein